MNYSVLHKSRDRATKATKKYEEHEELQPRHGGHGTHGETAYHVLNISRCKEGLESRAGFIGEWLTKESVVLLRDLRELRGPIACGLLPVAIR